MKNKFVRETHTIRGWRSVFVISLVAALIIVVPGAVNAQASPEGSGTIAPLAQASLDSWARRTWLQITDRDGSFYGRLAEEGVFQRFNPLQDAEYRLDLIGGAFGMLDEGEWVRTPEGLRLWLASISHPHLVNGLEARKRMKLRGGVALQFEYLREETLEADRNLAFFTFDAPDLFTKGIGAFAGISLKFFKPDADVEMGFRYHTPGLEITATFAVPDAFNDLLFKTLGVDSDQVEAHLDYLRQPLGTRLAAAWARGRVRGELYAGGTRGSILRVTFPMGLEQNYQQRERAYYAGGLLETDVARHWILGGYARRARAETERRHEDESRAASDFDLVETTQAVGTFVTRRISDRFSVAVQAEWVGRPETRVSPEPTESVDHDDDEWWASATGTFRPGRWIVRAGYLIDRRDAGPLVEDLTGTNQRLVVDFGFQFTSATRIEAGAGLDLDFGREGGTFDGGHLRLVSHW